MLPRAAISSRARRLDNSLDSSAMTKKPMPAKPDCVISTAPPSPEPVEYQATTSNIKATAAAVASASRRVVSTPDISTGKHQQRGEVQAAVRKQQVQRAERHEVHADGGQPLAPPLRHAVLRQRLRQCDKPRQQPQA